MNRLPFRDPQARHRCAPIIETERLILRELRLADLKYFVSFFSDANASQYVGGLNTAEDAWRRMLAGCALWPLTGVGMWAITRRGEGHAIGHGGFFDFLRDAEPSIIGKPEMGWILAPEAHGQGIAREACEAMVSWFRREIGRQEIWALIAPGNQASINLARNLDFQRRADGSYRGSPQTVWVRST